MPSKRRMLVGLLGANIQGSMSPSLFADAFAAAGIDGYYHLLDADRLPGRLPQLFDAIKTAGFIGANVTFPFKQEIIPLLDAVDSSAAQEREEIGINSAYLPKQLSDLEAASAISSLIKELEAATLKDMGRTMAALKERFAGRMDFSKAGAMVKKLLGGG